MRDYVIYQDVSVRQAVFNGTIPAGMQNVIVGPANYQWLRTVFIISFYFTFWGTKATGLSVGEGAFAFFQIRGLELNSNSVDGGGSPSTILNTAVHHTGMELDVFRRVQAGKTLSLTTNMVLAANSVGASTVEVNLSMFYLTD